MEGNSPVSDKARWFIALLPLLLGIAAYSFADPSPTPFDASKIDYSQFSDEEIARTQAHRDELKAKANSAIQAITETAVNQGGSISNIKKAGDDAKKSFEDYQHATEAQITAGNKAIAALDHVLKKLHLAKWIACGLVISVAGLIALKVPPPLGLYAAGAFAVAGTGAVWAFL